MTDQLPAVIDRPKIARTSHAANVVPVLSAAAERASIRFLAFFAANIRNPHTWRAYGHAVAEFLAWCETTGPVDHDRAAASRLRLDRDAAARSRRADRKAAPRRAARSGRRAAATRFDNQVSLL
jgi:hypothetical protein